MLRALILAVLVVASTTTLLGPRIDFDAHWHNFKVKYGKSYNDVEEYFRRGIFVRNLVRVLNHNFEQDLGLHSYRLAMNKFTDMLPSEVPKGYKGYKRSGMKMSHQFSLIRGKIPDSVDWRDKGLVTPIKDQAQCGSCWAFSAVASLEGQHAKAVKKLISLSEQNLVDCSGPEGNNGCDGGLMDQAFTYVIKNRGIDTEDSYPYEAKNGKCRFRNSTVGAVETSFVDVQSGNEKALQHAVATIGPISVGIDANSDAFQAYAGGVYEPADCKSDQEDLDHGVAVVGYGKDEQNGKDYWLVKNSWGTDWGESGYIKMARNKNNLCGIATSASYPVVPSL